MTPPVAPRPFPRQAQLVVLTVRFLTELGLVAGAAWASAARTRSVPAAVALGAIAAVAVAAVWGVWIAPASRRRLSDPARLVLELALFAAAVAGLVLAGHLVVAAVLAVVGAAAAVAVRFVPEEPVSGPRDPDAPLRRPRGRDRARPSS